ncbi:hypothetical protein H6F43_03400 [Leptolyngbya sp. FACHB-36]|uniref:hypothetical protein n=1 Tax=Leptolyngbya sp. FACHB-36 TaxID=2692808 RepID=UPI001681AD42|nr:hypothetical protein [Leptolyngbya sp. FACHB-36]MBD2019227.1 hypothetical protein [Leptolyngbya sp. FACHB-36]
MSNWLMVGGLVAIAYWLGYRQGWQVWERRTSKQLDRMARALGVLPEHPYWTIDDESSQHMEDQ